MLQKRFIDQWRAAADGKNLTALDALLADKAELVSPIVFEPVRDRARIRAIFGALLEVLPDLAYTRTEKTETGAVMVFEGTIAGTALKLEGVDVFTLGLNGKAMELKVFVRPLKAAMAFAEAMQKALT